MLKKCAPGHDWDPHDHRIWVTYNGKTFYELPTGHRSAGQVETGWIKKLASQLDIQDCAEKHLSLGPAKPKAKKTKKKV